MDITTLEFKADLGQVYVVWSCDDCKKSHAGVMVLDHVPADDEYEGAVV